MSENRGHAQHGHDRANRALSCGIIPFRPLRTGLFLALVLLPVSCAAKGSALEPQSEYVLGTVCVINLFEEGTRELYAEVFGRLRELEEILSANREGTDLDRVNQKAGIAPVKVKIELIEVLEKALEYAEKSGGLLDPSVGPLVKLWGIGSGANRVPGEEEIRSVLGLIDFRQIEVNRKEETVFLRRPGMALDLGAVAKGYAADEAVKILRREGVERAIIDLGGNIFALGERKAEKSLKTFLEGLFSAGPESGASPAKNSWRVGIQDPRGARGVYLGVLAVKNKSVVTSGGYERFIEEDGKRYHHIFSPKTGFPVENDLLSVTIAAPCSVDADALSTAVFALGWEKGRALVAALPGAEAIFVFRDLSVGFTEEIKNDFTLTAAEYRERP